jgi:small subunit ribosomal protein S6e
MSVRVVVSNPETGDSYQVEAQVNDFAGTAIGDEVDGGVLGLDGYTLELTGGSDDTGRPMRGDVEGQAIEEILVDGGTGFNPTRDGERRRVSVRGGEVGDATVQLNTKVTESGDTDIAEALGEGDEDEEE